MVKRVIKQSASYTPDTARNTATRLKKKNKQKKTKKKTPKVETVTFTFVGLSVNKIVLNED